MAQFGNAKFDNDCRSDRTRAGMKAALELGRSTFLAPIGYVNAPRSMGKSLMHDPERAPLVRRAFKDYATGLISEELFHRVQAILWGRVPSTALRKRAHPDFPLRGFGRCELCGRGLTGSKGHGVSCFEVALRERAA